VLDPLLGYLHVLEAGIVSSNHFSYNFGPQEGSLSVKQVANIAKSRWGDGAEYHFAVSPAADLKEATTLDLDVNLAINNLNWLPTWNQVEAIELTVDWWKKVADRELSAKEACCSDIDIALKNLRRYREVR
jgi:nucleoside-diphosphate-sugar epimerase